MVDRTRLSPVMAVGTLGGLACALSLSVLLGVLVGAAGPAFGQAATPEPTPGPAPERTPVDPELDYFTEAEWRALATGKTLTYMTPFGLMGREYYIPGGNEVVFVYFDGRCFQGTWFKQDDVYCFEYDGLHCFEHFQRGEDIIAREMDGDEQIVTEITDEVLTCEPELLSRVAPAPRLAPLPPLGAPG